MAEKNTLDNPKRHRQSNNPQGGIMQRGKNYINGLKENTQNAPIKQKAGEYGKGESDYAFRQRQKQQDDESPDNIKDRSLADVAGQRIRTGIDRGKDYANTQTNKAAGYGAQKGKKALSKGATFAKEKGEKFLDKNPKAAETAEKLKAFSNKRHEDIKKLKAKFNAAKLAKKKVDDEVKKIKMEIAKAAARFTLQIIAYAISAIASIAIPLLAAAVIIVIVYVAIDYYCNSGGLTGAACSAIQGLGSLVY